MNIERALITPGWMSEAELTYLATAAQSCTRIIEIGSWRGRSARALADNTPGTVTCVDTWADNAYGIGGFWTETDPADIHQHPNWLWHEFQKNLADHIGTKVFQVRMPSLAAARYLSANKYDLIFIDAGHTYDEIVADIVAWRPLIAEGGVLCGHDYVEYHPEVMRGVRELIPTYDVVDTIWTTEVI